MRKLARPGEFCPNPACTAYGKLQSEQAQPNLKKIGKTPRGVQRYQCKTCGKTFTETTGTLFFHKHTRPEVILEVLALLAEGNRISTLTRVKGIKKDTILSWLREAARHSSEVEQVLMKDFRCCIEQVFPRHFLNLVTHRNKRSSLYSVRPFCFHGYRRAEF